MNGNINLLTSIQNTIIIGQVTIKQICIVLHMKNKKAKEVTMKKTILTVTISILSVAILLFLLIFLCAQVKMFTKIKFYLSWWAYSFPIAAITIATYLMYSQTHLLLYKFILLCLFTLLSLFILLLLKNTICAMLNNRICVQED